MNKRFNTPYMALGHSGLTFAPLVTANSIVVGNPRHEIAARVSAIIGVLFRHNQPRLTQNVKVNPDAYRSGQPFPYFASLHNYALQSVTVTADADHR